MTTAYHTPHTFGDPLSAAELNGPLSQLDSGIGTIAAGLAGSSLAVTTTDASAGSGQAVVPVTATANFVVGQTVFIGDPAGTFESRAILSIQAAISLTMTANLTNTYASGTIVSASPSELVNARAAFATLGARITAGTGTAGAAFPGSPVSGDLFRHTGRNGATYYYTGAAWVQTEIPSVTAFWATPTTNDRCYRTDRRREYFYDGTRWLTTTLYRANIGSLANSYTGSATAGRMSGPVASLFAWWVEDFEVTVYVTAPNSGASYWNLLLKQFDGATISTITTINTSAGGADLYVGYVGPVNTLYANTIEEFQVEVAFAGTPGPLIFAGAVLTYRLVG